jgi:hypothetical protein
MSIIAGILAAVLGYINGLLLTAVVLHIATVVR